MPRLPRLRWSCDGEQRFNKWRPPLWEGCFAEWHYHHTESGGGMGLVGNRIIVGAQRQMHDRSEATILPRSAVC